MLCLLDSRFGQNHFFHTSELLLFSTQCLLWAVQILNTNFFYDLKLSGFVAIKLWHWNKDQCTIWLVQSLCIY